MLLWFGAVMAFAAHSPEFGAAIITVVLINGAFAFLQERRAERVVEALLERAAVTARVVRAGVECTSSAAELVPGDVVMLAAGEVVPADCVVVRAEALALDLSLLTGESAQVTRNAEIDARTGVDFSQRRCVTPAGAAVVRGTARALVVATGRASTLGHVEALLVSTGRGESLLERQVAELSRLTGVIAVVCGLATLGLAIALRGADIVVALVFATGVIVALVPEGLLPLLTVTLAMAARRMAARGALVRRLAAVEIVGASTVICTDKTGTLTQNTLDVLAFVPAPHVDDAVALARVLVALCNDTRDPIDRALIRWAEAGGLAVAEQRERHPRLAGVPFDPGLRYMRVECAFPEGPRQLIKGAPEALQELVGAPLPRELASTIEAAARHGERVLLLAEGPSASGPRYIGVLRLHDPPRPEVPAAITACHRAGVRVVMLTGDLPSWRGARRLAHRVRRRCRDGPR